MRNYIITLISLLIWANSANAQLADKKLIGEGKLYYFLLHIYDAKLYSDDGAFSFDKPFALKLEYKRKLYGKKIADRSAEEIRKIGFKDEIKLAAWHSQMKEIFPDVDDGVSITGFYTPGKQTVFYKNDKEIGIIKDPEFGKWFFGIWLNEKTSEPVLLKQLLGEGR